MTARVGPIQANEMKQRKADAIPSAVYEAINQLILKNFYRDSATVYQKDIVRILKEQGIASSTLFDNHWLDVEPYYEEAGWEVEYDKPGYNESYDAYFVFRKK